jgi:hypothetical protein
MNNIKQAIQANSGKIFTAKFVKKDGSIRTINARIGVSLGKERGKPTTANYPQYLTVYDMQKQAYRTLNLDTVIELRINKNAYRFDYDANNC